MSQWWNNEMANSQLALGQSGSGLTFQSATVPSTLLDMNAMREAIQQNEAAIKEKSERDADKATFLGSMKNAFIGGAGWINSVTDEIPGGKAAKSFAKDTLLVPIDKAASALYWVQSNVVSQPLSTAFLVSADWELNNANLFSGSTWKKAYHEAEHVSPMQAFANYENVAEASGQGTAMSALFGGGADNLSQAERDEVNANKRKYLYDTDFWRKKTSDLNVFGVDVGNAYDVGTGFGDGALQILADAPGAAIGYGARAYKAARNVKFVTDAKTGERVAQKSVPFTKARTVDDVLSGNSGLDNFASWLDEKPRSVGEIEQHPMWNAGRRKNNNAHLYSQFLAGKSGDEAKDLIRYFSGSKSALTEMATRSRSTASELGEAIDNRRLLESAKFDDDMLEYHRTGGSALDEGTIDPGKLYEPPSPRPTEPGAAQSGWDARWGDLSARSELHRQAVTHLNSMSPRIVGSAGDLRALDVQNVQAWRAAQLEKAQLKVDELTTKDAYYSKLLGANAGIDDISQATTSGTLFSSLDELHRMGSAAIRDTEMAASRKWEKKFQDRQWYADRRSGGIGGIASQVIRTGMYQTPVRVFEAFGDRMPPNFINHMQTDSVDRVSDMLRQTELLPEMKESLLAMYSNAQGKVERSRALGRVHDVIIDHVADRYGISAEVAGDMANRIKTGLNSTHTKLSGNRSFAPQVDPVTGLRADQMQIATMDGGEALVTTPVLRSQLSQGEPLLNVKALDNFAKRNASTMKEQWTAGVSPADAVGGVLDNLSVIWKAGTLLRAGYVMRNTAEATGAMVAKLGAMSAMANMGEMTSNFFHNRRTQIGALVGKGSYQAPGSKWNIPGLSRVSLLDPDELANVAKLNVQLRAAGEAELKTTRINVPKAFDVAHGFRKQELESLSKVDEDIATLRQSLDEHYGKVGQRAKSQYDLDNASARLSEAYARTAQLRAERTAVSKEILKRRYAGVQGREDLTPLSSRLQHETSEMEELQGIHSEAEEFLKAAEKGARDDRTLWGDNQWKYQSEQLDELRAWHLKVEEQMAKQHISTDVSESALKNAEAVAKRNVDEFNKVMERLVGDKEWWGKALTAAERHQDEMRRELGDYANANSYSDDLNFQEAIDNHRKLADKLSDKASHEEAAREFGDYAGAVIRQAEASVGRRIGDRSYSYKGITIPGAYSNNWQHPISRDDVTSEWSHQAQWARYEAIQNNRMARSGAWRDLTQEDDGFLNGWLHGVNRQFMNDEGMKRLLQDPARYRQWLNTNDGKAYRAELGPRGQDPDELIRIQSIMRDDYLPTAELQDQLARGEQIYSNDLDALDRKLWPKKVNGEDFKGVTSSWSETLDSGVHNVINTLFQRFATVPTDVLANHPIFARLQQASMKNMIDRELAFRKSIGNSDTTITKDQMNKLYEESSNKARSQMKTVVYDPQRTSASEAMRFVYPFLSAHMDGLQRWFGLIAEKPQLINTVSKVYGTPVAGNMVTDREGRLVGKDGYVSVKDEDGKVIERKFVSMTDRVFHLRMPGGPDKANEASTPIPIQNLNVFMPGDPWFNPGFGPLVQIAGSQVAKHSAKTGEFLEWAKVLPYGPTSTMQSLTPKWIREAQDYFTSDEGNESLQSSVIAIYNKQMAEWKLGGRKGEKPSMYKIMPEAKKFQFLQMLTAFSSPAQTSQTPLTGTPYQFYVDQYKQLLEADPQNANDLFYERYGDDYYQFTTSMTKSIGVSPTIEGLQKTGELRDLMEKDPDMVDFLIGNADKGKFSSTAYAAQQDMIIGGERVRGKLTAQQAADLNEVDEGWRKYNAQIRMYDSALIAQGINSYSDSRAKPILAAKSADIQALMESYPAWGKQYTSIDSGKVQRTIKSLTEFMQDSRVSQDPMRASEMSSLGMYLAVRQQFKAQLTALGAKEVPVGLDGQPNSQDYRVNQLAIQWNNFTLMLREQSLGFTSTYNRYLSSDRLQ